MDLIVAAPGTFGPECCRAFLILAGAFRQPVVGLPTGRTPVPLYETLRKRIRLGEISLARFAAPFAIDEYYVADRDDACANRAFFARHWEAIPGAQPVRQLDPLAHDLQAEARRFSMELAAAGGLDLVVLGIGANGHLAFNEPGSAPKDPARVMDLAAETREAAAGCFGEATPTRGLTLGLAEILAARRVLLLANGSAKAAIVARALEGLVGPECPASYLQQHPAVTVVLDSDAAAALRKADSA